MEIRLSETKGKLIAEVISDVTEITCTQDALDLMGDCHYQGVEKIIVHEKNLIPDFFDLKTGIAGDILQKFSTYNMQLAIVGEFTKFESKSLKDFIYESNKTGRILFVNSIDEAKEKLSR